MSLEIDAVFERYARRNKNIDANRYSLLSPVNLYCLHERQRVMLRLFTDHGLTNPSQARLLEVGAGSGNNLLEFLRIGFSPEHMAGVELLPDRASTARRLLPPGLELTVGDASSLVLEPSSFDLVFQSVVFSSLLDNAFQECLAQRMWSWLRPGGALLWYDFTYDNPNNPDVRGVSLKRIRELFPQGRIDHRRVTLAPPIARRVCQIYPTLYNVFNALPLLRTHLLCWIEKP